MREYLYNLLVTVDRCDVSRSELKSIIRHNDLLIRQLRNKKQYGGGGKGNGDGDGDGNGDENGDGEPAGTQEVRQGKPVRHGTEIDDPLEAARLSLLESEEALRQTEKTLADFRSGAEERAETLEIAKITGRFLNELSQMIKPKSGEYREIGEQVREIQNILRGYLTPSEIEATNKGK